MSKQRAFTLVEALVAVAIAGVVTVGVFSYFGDSIRGVAHSEKTMNALALMQEISRKARQHVYHMSLNDTGIGIDLCTGPEFRNIDLSHSVHDRSYPIRLIEVQNEEKLLKVDPSVVNYSKGFKEGKAIAIERRTLDSFFLNKKFPGEAYPFEKSMVVISHEIDQQKVTDHYLFTSAKKMIWRHYNEPANYLQVIEVDEKGQEEVMEEFGQKDKSVVNFSMNPITEIAYYKPDPKKNVKIIRFLRFFVEVNVSIRTPESDRGPSGGIFSNSFIVTSLFINGNRFGRGVF